MGNRDLLNHSALAVVGSRNTSAEDLYFSGVVGAQASSQGYALVSGGAKGVDETAMLGAINAEGTSVGVMADSLLKAATSAKWRNHLMRGNLALISPFYPEAGFNTGHAMARNKYVYCMADAALVVHSGTKGGTLTGAMENLKKNWIPLWVKETNDPNAGNAQIVASGGKWCDSTAEKISISSLLNPTMSQPGKLVETGSNSPSLLDETPSLFSQPETVPEAISEPPVETITDTDKVSDIDHVMVNDIDSKAGFPEPDPQVESIQEDDTNLLVTVTDDAPSPEDISSPDKQVTLQATDKPAAKSDNSLEHETPQPLFQLFLAHIAEVCVSPKTVDEISENLGLHKNQTKAWLAKAELEHKVEKSTRPVRYQWSIQGNFEGME